MKAQTQAEDERELVEAAQRDPRRFAELYERHFDGVYAYVSRRVANRAETEDIVSYTLHQALRNLKKFQWRGLPFTAWLYRIAANAIADRQKKASREQGEIAAEPVDESAMREVEGNASLFQMVRELPEDQRRVVVERFVEEKSVREIAEQMGRSEGAVKQLQFRALENLRKRMGSANAWRAHSDRTIRRSGGNPRAARRCDRLP